MLVIIRIGQGLVEDNVTEWISGHDADGLISKWGSTIKSPWVHTVTRSDMTLDVARM